MKVSATNVSDGQLRKRLGVLRNMLSLNKAFICVSSKPYRDKSIHGISGCSAIWGRSVTQNQLAYTTYIGDGDSSSFKRLSENDAYNSVENVRKEDECYLSSGFENLTFRLITQKV